MKIISWNVNGIPSKVKRGDFAPLTERQPEVICVQEVRTKTEPIVAEGYHHVWNHSERDGVWGTLTLCRNEPREVLTELGIPEIDREGRLIATDMGRMWIVNAYVPNASGGLRRREVRRIWDEALLDFAQELAARKPTLICGDFNVAPHDEDIYEGNKHYGEELEGFPTEERSGLQEILDAGFTDVFRHMHPNARDAYTWWATRKRRREVNRGWRLDLFLASDGLLPKVTSVEHLTDIYGSDHCPIELVMAK